MGRKKFNMDPKKVRFLQVHNWEYSESFILPYLCGDGLVFFSAGHRVSGGEWATQAHSRRYCSVPLQRRRAQQDCHWRLPWRKVHAPKIYSESFLLLFCQHVNMLFWSTGMISTSKFFRPLLTSTSSRIWTLSRPSGKPLVWFLVRLTDMFALESLCTFWKTNKLCPYIELWICSRATATIHFALIPELVLVDCT